MASFSTNTKVTLVAFLYSSSKCFSQGGRLCRGGAEGGGRLQGVRLLTTQLWRGKLCQCNSSIRSPAAKFRLQLQCRRRPATSRRGVQLRGSTTCGTSQQPFRRGFSSSASVWQPSSNFWCSHPHLWSRTSCCSSSLWICAISSSSTAGICFQHRCRRPESSLRPEAHCYC